MIGIGIALGVVGVLALRGFLRLDNPRKSALRRQRRRLRQSLLNRRA